MRSSTEMLIKFMRIMLGNNDTVPPLAIAEAADRLEEQQKRIKRLEEALQKIANQDYRGNRSTESQIAFRALEDKP